MKSTEHQDAYIHDVAIIGGGLAGLAAAHHLKKEGLSVIVLEASYEVGGRARSRPLGGEIVEFGGEWVGRKHVQLLALLRELGIATEPVHQLDHPILWRGTAGSRLLLPRLPASEVATLVPVILKAGRLARNLPPEEPWRSPRAEELDRITFGDWLRQQGMNQDGYYFLDKIVGALSSTPIDRLSLMHVLWWIARGSGPFQMLWTTFERRLPSGSQSIAKALAERIEYANIELNTPVTAISQDSDHVQVTTTSGETITARRAIVTAPITTLDRIAFDPPLPSELADLNKLKIDPGTKVIAHLPEDRVPRHRVFVGGDVLSGGWRVDTRVTGFAPPPAGDAPDHVLIADLAKGFGVEPSQFKDTAVYRWSEHPYIPGCDVGFTPGQLTKHGPHLRQPHGHIRFAGAERSSWPNNMEGAIESGTGVAKELSAELSDRRQTYSIPQ